MEGHNHYLIQADTRFHPNKTRDGDYCLQGVGPAGQVGQRAGDARHGGPDGVIKALRRIHPGM